MLLTLLSFTQLLLITILPITSADLVDNTCKKTPHIDFCVSTPRSDPHSSTVDAPKPGLVMVDKVDTNAKSTLTKINDLLGKSPDPGTKKALTFCKDSYKIVVRALVSSSRESLSKGDYKFVVDYMKGAASEASDCEAGFGGKSALSDLNDYENKAALVASTNASTLL